jgi:hypothetical protein
MKPIQIQVSPGELFDRITILRLKIQHATDARRGQALQQELAVLERMSQNLLADNFALHQLCDQLAGANGQLWQAEDEIRRLGRQVSSDRELAEVASRIGRTNDRRIVLKQQINALLGSAQVEEKVYR